MSRIKVPALLIVAGMIFLAGGEALGGDKITIHGDPCSVPLAKKIGEAFSAKTGVPVEVSSGLCRTGVTRVSDGEVDIGVSTFNYTPGRMPEGLTNTVIGKAPIVMVVNKENPVENISRAQLEGILSGAITNWKELGWKDLPIGNVQLPPCVKETMAYSASPSGPSVHKIIPETKGNPVTMTNDLVKANPSSIGMQLYGYETGDVKTLKIDGKLPGMDSVPAGYVYYENYNITTRGEPEGVVKEFIEFARSYQAGEIMLAMKHVPERGGRVD